MLEQINRYCHGFVAVPIILALRKQGVFSLLTNKTLSLDTITQKLNANPGYLLAAIRLLESLGWVSEVNEKYSLTEHSLIHEKIPLKAEELYTFDFDKYLLNGAGTLAPWIELIRNRWHLTDERWSDFLDGCLVLPLLITLKKHQLLLTDTEKKLFSSLSSQSQIFQEMALVFINREWIDKDSLVLTDKGKFICQRVYNLGVTYSYRNLLLELPQLLFGDCKQIFKTHTTGNEQHIDRSLNVIGSGFQHEKYFLDIEKIILSSFNEQPLEDQPQAIVDMGCGDGSLLKRLYETICNQSIRGKNLHDYPLTIVGVDYNQAALVESAKTLKSCHPLLIKGDINDPGRLYQDLKKAGINPNSALHIRSFLDHDRAFTQPQDIITLAKRQIQKAGVYIDENGQIINSTTIYQNYVEHFKRWANILGKHGLILLEVHCLPPDIVHHYLDESENLHFDALQAFSKQYLIEAETIIRTAAEAGLFPKNNISKRYPKALPYTRLTLNHFEKRTYSIRPAFLEDMKELMFLEEKCWSKKLQSSYHQIEQRILQYPTGQYILEEEGSIVAVLYTQRIHHVELVYQFDSEKITTCHHEQGKILQLITLNVLPEMQHQGFGDQLLEFVLNIARITSHIETVIGVTRCRDFVKQNKFTMEQYIQERTEQGYLIDRTLSFHEQHGAQIKGLVPLYRRHDLENGSYGVLIEYVLREQNVIDYANASGKETLQSLRDIQRQDNIKYIINKMLENRSKSPNQHNRPWLEIGFDSADLMELRSILSKVLNENLKPGFFFEYPTPAAVIEVLSKPIAENAQEKKLNQIKNKNKNNHASAILNPENEHIAVIGMGCRFPEGIRNPHSFWDFLQEGKDAIAYFPTSRQELHAYQPSNLWGGFFKEIDEFDAHFFNINPTEASIMDPQQRFHLEVVWEALENAAINPLTLSEEAVGIFVGVFSEDYKNLVSHSGGNKNVYFGTGTSAAAAAGGLAYFLGTQGPAITINTACSSSLVALHLARESLLKGDCTFAIASGVNTIFSAETTQHFSDVGMLSPDGRCKTFDASANGYVRSEGCAAVVLKRLSKAIEDGDNILAVIETTVVNQDGRSNLLTAPNPVAQKKLFQMALKQTGRAPEDVEYVEAHGTGTKLGDPMEIDSLSSVYGINRKNPLIVGSVKANIGHTESAAGLAGLIKVILSLQQQVIPKQPHFINLNPDISNPQAITIPKQNLSWKKGKKPRLAGVSSFGFSGTNAHVLVREAPENFEKKIKTTPPEEEYHLFTLSAKSREALHSMVVAYHQYLQTHSHLLLEDICYTTNIGRADFDYRLARVCSSKGELMSTLEEYKSNGIPSPPKSSHSTMQSDMDWFSNIIPDNKDKSLYDRLAHTYEAGMTVDWTKLYANNSYRKVELPTYPFQRTRYWFNKQANVHPLLGKQLPTLDDTIIFEALLTSQSPTFLKDHLIYNYTVIAGACYISALLTALRDVYKQKHCVIKNMEFIEPLIFANPDQERVLHTTLQNKSKTNLLTVEIKSYIVESASTNKIWQQHVKAELQITPEQSVEKEKLALTEGMNLNDYQSLEGLIPKLTGETWRESAKKVHYQFGQHFDWIKNIYSQSEYTHTARLRLPTIEESTKAYVLYPGFIDACFQAMFATLPFQQEILHIPFSIEYFEFNSELGMPVWVTVKYKNVIENKGIFVADLYLSLESGEIVGKVSHLTIRNVPEAALKRAMFDPTTSVRNIFYQPVWQEEKRELVPLSFANEEKNDLPAASKKTWLIFTPDLAYMTVLAKILTHEYGETIQVLPGEDFEKINERCYVLNKESKEDMQRLFLELQHHSLIDIIHAWSLMPNLNFYPDTFLQTQSLSTKSLLHLCQLLATFTLEPKSLSLWVFSNNVFSISETEPINITHSTLSGLCRSVHREHPQLSLTHLDIGSIDSLKTINFAQFFITELKIKTNEQTIAYRNDKRFVTRLQRRAIKEGDFIPFKLPGSYLISGGLGGLGLKMAEWLLEQGVQSLILISRHSPSIEASEKLDSLRSRGVTIQTIAGDVTNRVQLKKIIDDIQKSSYPLSGVIHAAGSIDDAIFMDMSWSKFENVLSAKVLGAWYLHELTKDLSLQHFILFSSISSMNGAFGQANYAAANSFLDALSNYRKQRNLCCLSINWGSWAEVGMAHDLVARHAAMGMKALSPKRALTAFEKSLQQDFYQLAVVDMDWDKYIQNSPEQSLWLSFLIKKIFIPESTFFKELSSLSAEQSRQYIKKHIMQLLRDDIGLTTKQTLQAELGLFDQGMDSLMAVSFRNRLQDIIGTSKSLSPTLLFDYPTINALTDYLYKLANESLALKVDKVLNSSTANFVQERIALSKSDKSNLNLQEPIAIVGFGCRFPQGADSPEKYWKLLEKGYDGMVEVPATRWDIDSYYDPDPKAVGKMITRYAGFINQPVDQFDTHFFNILPREAKMIDPQQRLLLEVTWEAFEDACIDPVTLRDSPTGVFIGIAVGDYSSLLSQTQYSQEYDPAYRGTGVFFSTASGRLSYAFGFQGPNLAIDTACSSSLVSIHTACQSLRTYETNFAVVGGVNLILSPETSIGFSKAQMLSPDGKCKTFDAEANGYARGEGCGVVLLKRLSDAKRDGNRILAVLRGSAINQDGASGGLTVPNGVAQGNVIRLALANAGMKAHEVSYVETHGTGTPLGDPIEVHALGEVYGQERSEDNPLIIGTVKTNIGHLEAASGIAGLIKVVLSLQNEKLPRHLHFKTLNPHIKLDFPAKIPIDAIPWPKQQNRLRRAGVSSFGFSGTNAHVIVEEAPDENVSQRETNTNVQTLDLRLSWQIFPISAKTDNALYDRVQQYKNYIIQHPELTLQDLAMTLQAGRSHFTYRHVVIAKEREELIQQLEGYKSSVGSSTANTSSKISFLLTGQGSQYCGMGKTLYETQPVFREAIETCAEILNSQLEVPLVTLLYGDADFDLSYPAYTQPVLFAIEYAIAKLWNNLGIEPDIMFGHSVGEVVAATLAGSLQLTDALRLIVARGRWMAASPVGAMMAVAATGEFIEEILKNYRGAGTVVIAAYNSPKQTILSGDEVGLKAIGEILNKKEIKQVRLAVQRAFHSPLLKKAIKERADFEKLAKEIKYQKPLVPWISNVTGERVTDTPTAEYWLMQAEQPVQFIKGMQVLIAEKVTTFIEIGPQPVLLGLGQLCWESTEHSALWLASLRSGQSDWQTLLSSIGQLYQNGREINWKHFTAQYVYKKLDLPTYPFQRQSYWALPKIVNVPNINDIILELKKTFNQSSIIQDVKKRNEANTLLDKLSSLSILRNLYHLGLQPKKGDILDVATLIEQYAIKPQYERLLMCCFGILAEDRYLRAEEFDSSGKLISNINPLAVMKWRWVAEPLDIPQIEVEWENLKQLIALYPDDKIELKLLVHCSQYLSLVMQGRQDPLSILFPENETETSLPALYRDTRKALLYNKLIAEAVQKRAADHKAPIRILEIGAGTGGTTAEILKVLENLKIPFQYTYTDISAGFFAKAKVRFKNYPVNFKVLNIERDPKLQGFSSNGFDIIIAANVLHATSNILQTVAYVRQLLAPKGLLVLLEVIKQMRWLDLTAGLLKGWWYFKDNIRESTALLTPEQWQSIFKETDFVNSTHVGHDQAIIIAQANNKRPIISMDENNGIWQDEATVSTIQQNIKNTLQLPVQYDQLESEEIQFGENDLITLMHNTPSNAKRKTLRDYLDKLIRNALQLPAIHFLEPSKGLFEQGMDSLMAVELRNSLQKAVKSKFELSSTLLFDYANLDDLSHYFETLFIPNQIGVNEVNKEQIIAVTQYNNDEPIAIIGIGCRFPQGANNPNQFWSLLEEGRDATDEIPPARWNVDHYYHPNPREPGKMIARRAGFITTAIDQFDASFFGISPREAVLMDPQQRLLMEVTWEALERAGITPKMLRGSQTGVFIGICTNDYGSLLTRTRDERYYDVAYRASGNAFSATVGRLSFTFGFNGPNLAIDTACSSSLVSVHMACQSLRNNESTLALAGGVNLMLSPDTTIMFSQSQMLAPDGKCKTFDVAANGFARGEGCGVVLLKRLSDAKRHGNRILALIRGSAINQDGASGGFTVPNRMAQEQVIHHALSNAGVKAHEINYVETHGTGTPLGDPIEVHALGKVYGQNRREEDPLIMGTIKTNIGHLEAASGIAGLIKVVLSLQNEKLPKHLHFKTLNPHIKLDFPAKIPIDAIPWPKQKDRLRRAGVSSFGFSGTNAHIIVEEAPSENESLSLNEGSNTKTLSSQLSWHIFPISARTEMALIDQIQQYKNFIKEHPDISLDDLALTLQIGRTHFKCRQAFIAKEREDLIRQMEENKLGTESPTHFINEILDQENSQTIQAVKELEQLSQLYQNGEEINWQEITAHYSYKNSYKTIDLPTYPFQRQRYWAIQADRSIQSLDTLADDLKMVWQREKSKQNLTKNSKADDLSETLSAMIILNSLMSLGWQPQLHEMIDVAKMLKNLAIQNNHARLVKRFFEILTEEGYLKKLDNSRWQVQQLPANLSSIENQIMNLEQEVQTYEEQKIEFGLLIRCGKNLNDVLQGRIDPLSLLFPPASKSNISLTTLYHESAIANFNNNLFAMAMQKIITQKNQKLRILEIGAGTGGTTAYVLPLLKKMGLDYEYIYTDISAGFFVKAKARFENYKIHYQVLNIENNPEYQGFNAHHFDIILSANALHATKDISQTLAHVRFLLKSQGYLCLLEVVKQKRWFDLTVGLLEGWWRFDDQWRQNSTLMSTQQWLTALKSNGFSHIRPIGDDFGEDYAIILAEAGEALHLTSMDSSPDTSVDTFHEISTHEIPTKELIDKFSEADTSQNSVISPSNQLKNYIEDCVRKVLQYSPNEKFEANRSFLEMGMDSLMMMEFINMLRENYGDTHSLSQTLLFDYPNIESLTEYFNKHTTTPSVEKEDTLTKDKMIEKDQTCLASSGQERLWFLDQVLINKTVYNVPIGFQMEGVLKVQALQKSMVTLVERHASLRTIFQWEKDVLMQKILSVVPVPIDIKSSENISEIFKDINFISESALSKLIQATINEPFNLNQGPLFRFVLFKISDMQHIFLMVFHHAIIDGESINIIIQELEICYNHYVDNNHLPNLSTLKNQYYDYALWQREWVKTEMYRESLAFWKENLANMPSHLALPTDHSRSQTFNLQNATYVTSIDAHKTTAIKAWCQSHNITLFTGLLTAYAILLHRYSNQEDIVIGSIINTRNQSKWKGIIGFFINTLALRIHCQSNQTVQILIREVWEIVKSSFANGDVPYDQVIKQFPLRRDNQNPSSFQTMFVLQKNLPSIELLRLKLNPLSESQGSEFELSLEIVELQNNLQLVFKYNQTLFEEPTIKRMAQHYKNLMDAMMSQPNSTIGRLPILTAREYEQQIIDWNKTDIPYQNTYSLIELFEQQAQKSPDNIALVFDERIVTYKMLAKQVNQLACVLKDFDIAGNEFIAIAMERSIEMIVTLLAILKMGAAYVPLDLNYPIERLNYMLKNSDAKLLISHSPFKNQFASFSGKICLLDEINYYNDDPNESHTAYKSNHSTNNLAYLIYTSGTTGKPKGVMIEQQSVINFCHSIIKEYQISDSDIILSRASVSFDTFVYELFAYLLVGAKVILASEQAQKNIELLAMLMHKHQVTTVEFFPSLLRSFINVEDNIFPKSLRLISCGGEELTIDLVKAFYDKFSIQLHNSYGPTETTIAALDFYCDPKSPHLQQKDYLPIGRPMTNTKLYVLDKHLQPLPIGVPGELYIGGIGLARGYLNDEALTSEKFINNHFIMEGEKNANKNLKLYKTGDRVYYLSEGTVVYVGRMDNQIKLRGYRIELGEIESQLITISYIKEAVVLLREDQPDLKRIIAYVVPTKKDLSDLESKELTNNLFQKLIQSLPKYMIPSAIVILPSFPLLPNGKLNKSALPVPNDNHVLSLSHYQAPRNVIELKLMLIWQKMLGIEHISIYDNFFDLGGNSLSLIQMASHIKKLLDIELSLATLYKTPTIAELAPLCVKDSNIQTQKTDIILPVQKSGSQPPLFLVHPGAGNAFPYLALNRLFMDQPIYGINNPRFYEINNPFNNIEEMASIYIQAIKTIQATSPYRVGGWSLGGTIALEIAHQLEKNGDEVEIVLMLDSMNLNCLSTEGKKVAYSMKDVWVAEGVLEGYEESLPGELQYLQATYENSASLALNYCSKPYGGRIVLFKVKDKDLKFIAPLHPKVQAEIERLANSKTNGWDILNFPQLEVYNISGNHYELFNPVNVKQVAEKIRNVLTVHSEEII